MLLCRFAPHSLDARTLLVSRQSQARRRSKMSAAGVSASASSSVMCQWRKASMQATAPTIKRDGTPHFYIPGEATTGVFPGHGSGADHDSRRKRSTSTVWSLIQTRLWNIVQATLKKGNEFQPQMPIVRMHSLYARLSRQMS